MSCLSLLTPLSMVVPLPGVSVDRVSPRHYCAAQLTGRDDSHLVAMPCGNRMQSEAAQAFTRLQRDAGEAGFELAIASSFRSFARQADIWNGKACGVRPIHDDSGRQLVTAELSPRELLHAILRFSALPGTSRHHWGTDVDVYDLAAIDEGYSVQLTPQEVAPGGRFDAFHRWLDTRIAADESQGFFRPYIRDGGVVAVERWHLSYAPISFSLAHKLTAGVLIECWDDYEDEILLRLQVEESLSEIIGRYCTLAENWCPVKYHRTP